MRPFLMRPFLVSILGLISIGLVTAAPAAADCSSPMTTFSPHEVDRGGELVVTGKYWGASCYDTGPPPDGHGGLGVPLDDIEIVLIQGNEEWVIGTTDAGHDYGFAIAVVVPREAAPGDAQLLSRSPRTHPELTNPDPTLHISNAAPIERPAPVEQPTSIEQPTPTSGTTHRTEPASADIGAEDVGASPTPWLFVVTSLAACILVGGAWALIARRRSH